MTPEYDHCSDEVKARLEAIDYNLTHGESLPPDWGDLHAEINLRRMEREELKREKQRLLAMCGSPDNNPPDDNPPGDNPSHNNLPDLTIPDRGIYVPPSFVYPRSLFDKDKEIKSYEMVDPLGDGIDCGGSHIAYDLYFDGINWGTPVYAMKSDSVFVARNTGYPCSKDDKENPCPANAPNEVVIDEKDGWFTSYTHVYPNVTVSQTVPEGYLIGWVNNTGFTGNPPTPHVHVARFQLDTDNITRIPTCDWSISL